MATTELEKSSGLVFQPKRAGRALLARLRVGMRRGLDALERSRRPDPETEPYVPGSTRYRGPLVRAALLGTVASLMVLLGATQQNSPFTEKSPGAWFFGIPLPPAVPTEVAPPGRGLFLGVVLVYGGMLLMLRAWSDLAGLAARYPGLPLRRFVWIFLAWIAPLLVVAPLFSKDVYSYVAQGEQMTRGINPYLYGPNVLGATTFSRLVDPLWGNVTSPYGPVFLGLAGAIVSLTHHHELMAVVGMRLLALIGTVMFAIAVPVIARTYHRDGARAFTLAALNPLVLFNLIAGAHNDALMLGFLTVGFAFARRGRPIIGILLCGVAAAVKVPALLGAVYIGWEWLGPNTPTRERLRPTVTALGLSVGVLALLSEVVGLGWGWIKGLSNPDTVWSWMDPPTAIGLWSAKVVNAIGLGDHTHVLLTVARGTGLVAAGVIAVWLLLHSQRIGTLTAIGWTFLAVVLLSPVVQPWYMTWGFVFLAPIAEGRTRRVLVWFSGASCFVGLSSGRVLADELAVANPFFVAIASVALVALVGALVWPRARRFAGELGLRSVEAST